MKQTFDYNALPSYFAHCFNANCLRADQCLRHKMAILLPKERETVLTVNHLRFLPNGEDCTFFKNNETRLYAKGISALIDSLPHAKAITIRQKLVDHFGKSLYYRFYRKEALISPDQQSFFKEIFKAQGIAEPPVFDELIERYE